MYFYPEQTSPPLSHQHTFAKTAPKVIKNLANLNEKAYATRTVSSVMLALSKLGRLQAPRLPFCSDRIGGRQAGVYQNGGRLRCKTMAEPAYMIHCDLEVLLVPVCKYKIHT